MTLEELAARCKGTVMLEINPHLNEYESLSDYLYDSALPGNAHEAFMRDDITTLYELQFYPDTPVGFYVVYGKSLADVLEQAEAILANP